MYSNDLYLLLIFQTHHCCIEPKPAPLNVARTLEQLRSMTPFEVQNIVYIRVAGLHLEKFTTVGGGGGGGGWGGVGGVGQLV